MPALHSCWRLRKRLPYLRKKLQGAPAYWHHILFAGVSTCSKTTHGTTSAVDSATTTKPTTDNDTKAQTKATACVEIQVDASIYLNHRGMLAIRPVGRLVRKSRHLQAFRLRSKNTEVHRLRISVVLNQPNAWMLSAAWCKAFILILGTKTQTRPSTQPCSEGLLHLLHIAGRACRIVLWFQRWYRHNGWKQTHHHPYHSSRLRPPSAAAAPQIRPLHLVAEHANELLHPFRDGLRHPLGEVGALGADDQLLVGAVFVHVVDRAAQNLRATKRKRDRPKGKITHRNKQVR